MHIEFSYMLSAALRDYLQAEKAQSLEHLIFSEIELEEPEKKRLTATYPLGASSSIAFKLSQKLILLDRGNEAKEKFYGNNVAQALRKHLEKYNLLPFVLEVSGSTYLNAYLSKESCEKLFRIFLQTSEKDFFSLTSLLNPKIERISKFEIKEYKIDWQQMLSRFAASKDLSEQNFVKEVGKQKELSLEQRLLLLAALADKELDLRIYLQGLAGRENIPWYFAKFIRDCSDYLSFLNRKLNDSNSASVIEKNDFIMPKYLQNGVYNFFSLRKVFFESFYYSKPEKLMNLILSQLRSFYDLYNRPNFRMLPPEQFCREEILALKLYLEKLHSLINYIFPLWKQ